MRVRVAALVVIIVLGVASLSPVVQLAYATSGSMEPAIPTNSLYLVSTLDGAPERGDIVMYDSEDQVRVTHRVVDVVDGGGYITKGDANDAPDQRSDADALRPERVIGVVPTVFGQPAVVPGSAVLVQFTETNPIAALLSALLLFGAGFLFTTGTGTVVETRRLVLPVLTVAFIASVVFVTIGVTHPVAFIATTGPHEGNPELVPANQETTQMLSLRTSSPPLLPSRVVSATGNLTVVGTEEYANGTNATVRVPEIPAADVERGAIVVNYYPPVVPSWMLSTLHRIHPALAAVVTVSICYLPVYLLYQLLVDPRKRLRPYMTGGGVR